MDVTVEFHVSGVTRVSCARGQKQRSAPPGHRRLHVVSVSIGADVRKVLRGSSTLSTKDAMIHATCIRNLLRSVGRHKLPSGVWSEAPAANVLFAFLVQ